MGFSKCYANSVNEKVTQECLKHYLKDRGVTEDILDYIDNYIGSISDCESAVKGKLADIYSILRQRLQNDRINRPHVECVLKDVEEDDDVSYENLVLREAAVEMISNWRFWKYFSKNSRLEEIRNASEEIIKKSLLKCKGNREFGDMFTRIMEGANITDQNGYQEYCIRQTLLEKGYINEYNYNFQRNPKSVPTVSLDCKELYDSIVNQFYENFDNYKEKSECVRKIYKDLNYADYVIKVELLSKLVLSRSDKSKEKQNFINDMVTMSYETKNC